MSRLFRITLWVLFWLLTPLSLLFILANGLLSSPTGVLVALPIGLLFVGAFIFGLHFLAQWPFAGWKWVCACLGAGIGCCGAVLTVGQPIMTVMEKLGWDVVAMSFGGAYPEEIIKASCVVVILLSFRELDRPWHGFITGAMVGLGFEFAENLMYTSVGALFDPDSDVIGGLIIAAVRILAGPGLHVMFTSISGWGIAWALFDARATTPRRWLTAIGWFLVGFGLHFTWNLMPETPAWQVVNITAAAVIGYPLWIWLAVRGHKAAKQDIAARPGWHAPRNPRARALLTAG